MLKVSAINPSSISDESGRNIAIATGPRIYFRKSISTADNDLSKMSNLQLDDLIASDVAGSENVKTFVPKSSGIVQGNRDLGIIKKSKQYNMFYICIASGQQLRVIKVQTEIREGKAGGEKMPSKVDTGIADSRTGKSIRITTTVRKIFRNDYKDQAFPIDTNKTFDNAGIKELSDYIGKLVSSADLKYEWHNPRRPESDTSGGMMEIRSFGANSYFVLSIKSDFLDVISVQSKFMTPALSKSLEAGGAKKFDPSRDGKKPRKEQHGTYDKGTMPYGQR